MMVPLNIVAFLVCVGLVETTKITALNNDKYTMCTRYRTLTRDVFGSISLNENTPALDKEVSSVMLTTTTGDKHWYVLMNLKGRPLKIASSPTQTGQCSSHSSLWMLGAHPAINDGVVQRTLCVNKGDDHCSMRVKAQVRRCHGHYVYRLDMKPVLTDFTQTILCAVKDAKDDNGDETQMVYTPHSPEGMALTGHVMAALSDVASKTQCFIYCLLRPSCQSFNYSPRHVICELNSGTKYSPNGKLAKMPGYRYYETVTIDSRHILI